MASFIRESRVIDSKGQVDKIKASWPKGPGPMRPGTMDPPSKGGTKVRDQGFGTKAWD